MRAAVQLLYDKGKRRASDSREHYGELETERRGTAIHAVLRHPNGNRQIELLPPLYDARLAHVRGDILELRGVRKERWMSLSGVELPPPECA